ncbi:prolyl oligopeptidase family serine peptidase [Arcanobacterium buesumense]|uniref:S9 family peptidase n=1 Tax=Arcanobacterium buesumense TaxID=2722751 RepID=A0A6H2EK25_9ACTO|nr:prolyl oligopeptidase family serine peptidase [Arcanobacterium buesumense]QJC21199.1 S9 family peptidase [Arcanobacterium buesumense]
MKDKYQYLEELSEANMAWAKEVSTETVTHFSGPEFTKRQEQLDTLLSSKDQLILANKRGEYAYNFYTDGDHPRGLWRRTSFDSYLAYVSPETEPEWEVLLDIDELGKNEDQSWVFGGAQLLFPTYDRALISLHPGGSDTNVIREFDLITRSFVTGPDAFIKPNSKGAMSWVDRNTVVISADFGPDSLTASGYPLSARLWSRGQDLSEAVEFVRGEYNDVIVGAYYDHTPGHEKLIARRATDFRTDRLWNVNIDTVRQGKKDDVLAEFHIPESAIVSTLRDWTIIDLRYPWELNDTIYSAGSLLAIPTHTALNKPTSQDVEVLYCPSETSSLLSMTAVSSGIVFTSLDNVQQRFWFASNSGGDWAVTELHPDIPPFSTVSIAAVDAHTSDEVWVTSSGFLHPTTLFHGHVSSEGLSLHQLRQSPHRFNTSGLTVLQRWATSQDGTKIPYFVVGPEEVLEGKRPARTLLDGYGGFEVSRLPSYISTYGKMWLEKGYVYALSNIRGGGEFGPRWHQAALRENRHKAYEDHAAVAADLVSTGITTVPQLAATGGSNGGMLMGNMYTTYPQHFGAIVCRVPLLDMKRFSHLLAGASWMEEYGNPDTDDWNYLRNYSPYHNVKSGPYPPILITTSTRDDRVHPGHARKFYQKLRDHGFTAYYHENTEGGHAGAADIKQTAQVMALIFSYLDSVLAP